MKASKKKLQLDGKPFSKEKIFPQTILLQIEEFLGKKTHLFMVLIVGVKFGV